MGNIIISYSAGYDDGRQHEEQRTIDTVKTLGLTTREDETPLNTLVRCIGNYKAITGDLLPDEVLQKLDHELSLFWVPPDEGKPKPSALDRVIRRVTVYGKIIGKLQESHAETLAVLAALAKKYREDVPQRMFECDEADAAEAHLRKNGVVYP